MAAGGNVNGVGGDVDGGSSDKVRGPVMAELIGNLLLDVAFERPDGFWKSEETYPFKI